MRYMYWGSVFVHILVWSALKVRNALREHAGTLRTMNYAGTLYYCITVLFLVRNNQNNCAICCIEFCDIEMYLSFLTHMPPKQSSHDANYYLVGIVMPPKQFNYENTTLITNVHFDAGKIKTIVSIAPIIISVKHLGLK